MYLRRRIDRPARLVGENKQEKVVNLLFTIWVTLLCSELPRISSFGNVFATIVMDCWLADLSGVKIVGAKYFQSKKSRAARLDF